MKKSNLLMLLLTVVFICDYILLQHENQSVTIVSNEFSIGVSNPLNVKKFNSEFGNPFNKVEKILLTIQNINGTDTKYRTTVVKIMQSELGMCTEMLTLKNGTYKITEFDLINSDGRTVYSTPMIGSQVAKNVRKPLPVVFKVSHNSVYFLNSEVLVTNGHQPTDFGIDSFQKTQQNNVSSLMKMKY